MGLEIKQLTRLQIIRYCEKLEKENKKLKEKIEKMKEGEQKFLELMKNYIISRNEED